MKRRLFLKQALAGIPTLALAKTFGADNILIGNTHVETMGKGPFLPEWGSLQNYKTPEWFREAKFGIWAHLGSQCQPGHGDWYARSMYIEGSDDCAFHVKKYGHPSKFGFKDFINEWKADSWDPENLVKLYKVH